MNSCYRWFVSIPCNLPSLQKLSHKLLQIQRLNAASDRGRRNLKPRFSMDHDQSCRSILQRTLKGGQGRCHRRMDSLRGFRFYQPQLCARTWDKKIYFQTLLIAKIVEFPAHPTVGLTLEYFRRDEAFKQRSKERRALKLGRRCQAEQIAGKTGVAQVDFRRLNQSLSEIFEI